jgi:hypothetical protein
MSTKLSAFALTVAFLLQSIPANAFGYASLVSCRSASTRGGQLIYVGIYTYNGRRVQLVFDYFCPPMVEIDEF